MERGRSPARFAVAFADVGRGRILDCLASGRRAGTDTGNSSFCHSVPTGGARRPAASASCAGLYFTLLVGIILGLVGWINQDYLKEQINWVLVMRPYMLANFRPFVLTPGAERALQPLQSFRECGKNCPEMIVIPVGQFIMGSSSTEKGRRDNEGPQHTVTIGKPFAVAKFDVTFDDWDACFAVGGCPNALDAGFGRGTRPVISVNFYE